MYAALNKNGQLIEAIDADISQKYFCSQCSRPVKLINHDARCFFRHENATTNNINERLLHLHGKELIIETLKKYLSVELKSEYYLEAIKQRPDILVNDHIAIEYQCAKINLKTFASRVEGYHSQNIKNLWILGEGYLSKKVSREHLKFLNYSDDLGYYLLMLDSKKERFTIFYQIYFKGPFSRICFQKKIFSHRQFGEIFNFYPQKLKLQSIKMDDYLLSKLRRKNDTQSQAIKLSFYQHHQKTAEEFLRGKVFMPQAPIYARPAWQIVCSHKRSFLRQPLLELKKPPQE